MRTGDSNISNAISPIPVPWVALKKKLLKIIQYPLAPTHRGETKIVIALKTTPLLIGLRQPKLATNQINMLCNDCWILVERTGAKQKIETVQWFPLLDLFKKELKIPIQTVAATLPSVPKQPKLVTSWPNGSTTRSCGLVPQLNTGREKEVLEWSPLSCPIQLLNLDFTVTLVTRLLSEQSGWNLQFDESDMSTRRPWVLVVVAPAVLAQSRETVQLLILQILLNRGRLLLEGKAPLFPCLRVLRSSRVRKTHNRWHTSTKAPSKVKRNRL